MRMLILPTQSELKRLLDYDEESGNLIWKVSNSNRVKIGDIAGCVDKKTGYKRINVNGCLYYAQRLIWVYHKGSISVDRVIDHIIPEFPQNNRINNLQSASFQQNNQKKNIHSNNTSGFKGVSWVKNRNRWYSCIMVDYKPIHLGSFTNKEDAVAAYDAAAIKLFGNFAVTNFPKESYSYVN